MTSRERVLLALDHKQSDRVAVDLGGHRSSGIAAIAYRKLRARLGLPERDLRVYDPVQQLAVVENDVLDLFGVDTVELGRAFDNEPGLWVDWQLPDGSPCKMPHWASPVRADDGGWEILSASGRVIGRMPAGALYFEQTFFPLAHSGSTLSLQGAMDECLWTAIGSPPGPLAAGLQGRSLLRKRAREFRQNTDRAIIGLFGGNLVELGQFLFRHDNFFMMLAAEPRRAHRFLDEVVELHLANLERYLADVGEYIDIIVFGDDMGTQAGPQFSPDMYREFFMPRHRKMWQRARELADVRVMLHCCGGVRPLLDDMIDAGLDAVNPVQISCEGMDAEGLKRDFGSRLTFWGGGCDTRSLLNTATPAEVREHVHVQLQKLSPGGGFVFQQVHNILADVPPENVAAMYEAVREFNGS
jgi:uroporphyrinogen decarboxylase